MAKFFSARRSAVFAVVCAAMLHCELASAQGGPPMITDDPGTPGDGHWEINIAGLSERNDAATIYQLPLIDLNYGVGDRIQLKYEVPWIVLHADGGNRSGLGSSLAGVKWRFFDAGEDGWQISTYPQVEFNYPDSSSPRRGLATNGTSYLLPLEFMRSFENFDLNVEVGRWLHPASEPDTWVAGLVLGHEVEKGFELIAELHDETTPGFSRDELIVNFGARWDFSERYSLLAAAGRDLHNSLGPTNTLITYFGLQMRL